MLVTCRIDVEICVFVTESYKVLHCYRVDRQDQRTAQDNFHHSRKNKNKEAQAQTNTLEYLRYNMLCCLLGG